VLRTSCYFNAVDIGDGSSLLYNGLSLCIDAVPSSIAHGLAATGEGTDFSFLSPAEKEYLLKRGHLTSLMPRDEMVEMGEIARAMAKRDRESNELRFRENVVTFILTYRCNLDCDYCYQRDVRKESGLTSMSEVFVDDFFDRHLQNLLPGRELHEFSFSLYGGEPLLPVNRPAIERILRHAGKHRVPVSTVTNAVMVPEMLDLIGPEYGQINNVQVTLDGGQAFHDTMRVSQAGGPTFEQTIAAVRQVMDAKANAIVRVHLHPRRLESARALVRYLDEEKILGNDRTKVYFWSTDDLHREALSPEEYSLFSALFEEVALKQGQVPTAHFAFLEQIMAMKSASSGPIRRHCDVCVTGLHCVIDSDENIYECIDDAGHRERRIGTVAGGAVEYLTPAGGREKPHLSDKPECLECPVALFCGGGCVNRQKAEGSASRSFCLQVKDFVALTLRSLFLLKKEGALSE
jgi:uncharacterized protein